MSRLVYQHPRDQVLQTMERIYGYRMTTTSGGNISIRERSGDLWITPARVDKGSLRREDIVRIGADGTVRGVHAPSSELPLHTAVYNARPDFAAVVHAHPVALVAFSMVRQVPDTRLFHQARHVCGEGGFASYALPGSQALGETTAEVFRRGHHCVILENHGVITGGSDIGEAFSRFEMFEFTAKTIIEATLLGRVRYLTDIELQLPETRRNAMPEFGRDTPESAEIDLRVELCRLVERAYRQRLFTSSQGSFSVRVDAGSFLITPYRFDRANPKPEEIVLVRDGRAESGTTASRAALLHFEIYRRHPNIAAVINAYPVNATAFSVTGEELDTRTIPESYVVLRHVGSLPYGLQFTNPAEVAQSLSLAQPSSLLANDGVLVTGESMLQAFDRLEVLESTASALINSRALGQLSRLPDEVVLELDRAFLSAEASTTS